MRKIVISDELRRIAEEYRAAGQGGAVGLSEAAGLSKTAVRDAIRTGNPTIRTLVPLADYLNVPLEQLIFGTESRSLEIPVVGIVAAGDGWVTLIVRLATLSAASAFSSPRRISPALTTNVSRNARAGSLIPPPPYCYPDPSAAPTGRRAAVREGLSAQRGYIMTSVHLR